jgi:hypothetical protein
MSKARGYLAKSKQCEERAQKVRCPDSREWQLILARTYRMLAEAEVELATRRSGMTRPYPFAPDGGGFR